MFVLGELNHALEYMRVASLYVGACRGLACAILAYENIQEDGGNTEESYSMAIGLNK